MSVRADFAGIETVEVLRPAEQRVPYVFSSPHSGRHYPERFLAQSKLDRYTIRRSEDFDVDRLFSSAVTLGAPLVRANFPRAYLDVNREPMELDPAMFSGKLPSTANVLSARVAGGLGTVPRVVGEGLDIYREALKVEEALERIELLYEPYHDALSALLEETRQRFGYAVLVDCHSMPGGVRAGGTKMRPDIIVGDRFGTSAAHGLSRHAIASLKRLGFQVAYNKPYAGGHITGHYGQPVYGIHAIQIEVSRRLYMNERTLQPNTSYPALRALLHQFCNDLTAYPDAGLYPLPMAAE
ncbi:MAG: N-formylglutamate amidohydrolase [Brucellaceae bacterium]|nr:N-formylglutamate amidohydrolase [Brucellaceae bacterium]